jgi:hypothetical protein
MRLEDVRQVGKGATVGRTSVTTTLGAVFGAEVLDPDGEEVAPA